jgi:hypothetical protein
MFPCSIIKLKLEDARQGGEGEGKKTTVNFMPNSNTCLFTQQTFRILAQHNASARCNNQGPAHPKQIQLVNRTE